jgi:hypothetical protein
VSRKVEWDAHHVMMFSPSAPKCCADPEQTGRDISEPALTFVFIPFSSSAVFT